MPGTEHITSNAATVAAQLNALAGRLADPAPALRRAQALIAASERRVFDTQGGSLGAHWPPAAEGDRKTDSRLLVATGRLRASLTGSSPLQIRGNTVEVGTDVPYAIYHQYGTSRMPARPFLGIDPSLARSLVALLQQAVEEQV